MSSVYCPACGAMSYAQVVQRADREVTECGNCGLALASSRPLAWQPLNEILFADDSDLLRIAVEDVLLDRKLARSVIAAGNGQDFLEKFTRRLRQSAPVDLVMLDVQMPVMTGFNAAVALRAIERAFDVAEPTPLVFFSSQPCDDKARKVLQFCGRAIYVNKVASPNLAELAQRVEQVLVNLLTQGSAH